jgi:hypothetical protein
MSKPMGLFLLFSALCLVTAMLLSSYRTDFSLDWALYYPNVEIYQGVTPPNEFKTELRIEYFSKRTPYTSLIASFLLQPPLSPSFAYFQIASLTMTSVLFFAILTLIRLVFNERAFRLSLILLPFMPFLIRHTVIGDQKFLATFFTIFAFSSYLDILKKNPASKHAACLFGLFAAAATMTHPSMLFYLLPLLLYHCYRAVFHKAAWHRELFAWTFLAIVVLVLPWFAWQASIYSKDILTPTISLSQPTYDSHWQRVKSSIEMLFHSIFIPNPLYKLIFVNPISITPKNYSFIGQCVCRLYSQSFIAQCTLTGTFVSIAVFISKFRKEVSGSPKAWENGKIFALCFGLGAFISVMIVPYPDLKGIAANNMAPLCILVFGLHCHLWSSFSARSQRFLYTTLFGEILLVQSISILTSHSIHKHVYEYLHTAVNVHGFVANGLLFGLYLGLLYFYASWAKQPEHPKTPPKSHE